MNHSGENQVHMKEFSFWKFSEKNIFIMIIGIPNRIDKIVIDSIMFKEIRCFDFK